MRTTITIPASLRQKLVNEAARRNIKGYSRIISEALEVYFSQTKKDSSEEIKALRGCMSHHDLVDASRLIEEGRANWKM